MACTVDTATIQLAVNNGTLQANLVLSADPTNTAQLKTDGLFVGAGVLPSGAIVPYGGAAAPAGWLVCDGSAVLRSQYQTLFNVIGTTFGAGDGSTTFTLPDMRGRVPVGYAASGGHVDVAGIGRADATALANRRPSHRHTPHQHNIARASNSLTPGGTAYSFFQPGGPTLDSGTELAAGGSGVTTDPLDAPAYIVTNFIVKT